MPHQCASSASWADVWPMLALRCPILALSWPILGLCWAHVEPMLARAYVGPSWRYLGLCWPSLSYMLTRTTIATITATPPTTPSPPTTTTATTTTATFAPQPPDLTAVPLQGSCLLLRSRKRSRPQVEHRKLSVFDVFFSALVAHDGTT